MTPKWGKGAEILGMDVFEAIDYFGFTPFAILFTKSAKSEASLPSPYLLSRGFWLIAMESSDSSIYEGRKLI